MSTKEKNGPLAPLQDDNVLPLIQLPPVYAIETWLTYNPHRPDVYEYVSPISETIPDMVPDIRLLLERSSQGIPVPTRADGYSEQEYPDLFKMDEFEIAEFRENLAHQMQDLDQQLAVSTRQLDLLETERRNNVVTKQDLEDLKSEEKKEKKKTNEAP